MKSIYQASYEESREFVNEKYVVTALKESGKGQVNKRLLGITVTLLFVILMGYGSIAIEKGSPYHPTMLSGKILPVWIIGSIGILIFSIIGRMRYRNFKVESDYEFTKGISSAFFLFVFEAFLFFLSGVNMVFGSIVPSILYFIVLLVFLFLQVKKVNSQLLFQLYGKDKRQKENSAVRIAEKFQKFANRYGGPIIIVGVIIRHFAGSNKQENYGLLEQIGVILSPLVLFLVIWLAINWYEKTLKGFYLKKYSEEFRIQYGYTKKEWYGPKSKAYLTDPAEQEVAQQRTNQANGDGQVRFKKIDK